MECKNVEAQYLKTAQNAEKPYNSKAARSDMLIV